MVLLDTNILVEHLAGRYNLTAKVMDLGASSCFVSSIVYYELLYGALRSARNSERDRVSRLLEGFVHLPFDNACAIATARVRKDLESVGMRIGPYDLQIAGSALAYGLILVTHNVGEFERIPNLRVEDWQSLGG